jgi:hypothetical protein
MWVYIWHIAGFETTYLLLVFLTPTLIYIQTVPFTQGIQGVPQLHNHLNLSPLTHRF